MSAGLLDTSVFVAGESGRKVDSDLIPDETQVCVITVAELEAGVLAASDLATRRRRLATLQLASRVTPLPVDSEAASQWAGLRVRLHEAGRRLNANDSWIAAIALARGLPVVTQDDDFDVLADLGLLEVIKV